VAEDDELERPSGSDGERGLYEKTKCFKRTPWMSDMIQDHVMYHSLSARVDNGEFHWNCSQSTICVLLRAF
jgi:hypothetical protein